MITLYIDYARAVVDTLPEMILSAITMLFMSSAFCAGWFYMVKKSIRFSAKEFILDSDRKHEALKLIKTIPVGIGKFFLHYVTVSLLFVLMALSMVFLVKVLSAKYVTQINDILAGYGIIANNMAEIELSLDKLPQDILLGLFDKIMIPALKLISVVVSIPTIFSFLLMLWMPEIINTYKNPLLSIFTSIKKIFKNFAKSVNLYIYIAFIQMLISTAAPFALSNLFLYMLFMIIYFYFIVYVVVLIFIYYDTICRQNDKIQENS